MQTKSGKKLKWEIREATNTVKKSGLTDKDKEALLIIRDYFMARNVFSCIAETFKIQARHIGKTEKIIKRSARHLMTEYVLQISVAVKYILYSEKCWQGNLYFLYI